MLKLKVGDKVRSYDFQDRTDCFFEGEVKSINEQEGTFTCKTSKQVFRGDVLDLTSQAFTAIIPGYLWLDDDSWTNRIELI